MPNFTKIATVGSTTVLFLFMMSACALVKPVQQSTTPTAPKTIEETADSARLEVTRLLAEARELFLLDQLTTPLDANAYFRYLQVLSIDEDNSSALQGLNDIVEKYMMWAIDAANLGYFRDATHYLNTARSIDETHPNIVAVETRISDLRNADHESFRISAQELSDRSEDLAAKLHDLGRSAVSKGATITIVAGTDESGRWIYQQLNAKTEARVRARLETGYPPEVQLRY